MTSHLLTIRNIFCVAHDRWQLVLTILGESGTGKSRLIQFIRTALGKENTSVIGNETETTFGLASHCDSMLCILEEMTREAKLSVSDWLNMVTGDTVEVRRKYKGSMSMDWRANMIIVGNEFAGWLNNQGNVVRRLFILMFTIRPSPLERDTTLDEQIMADLGGEILLVIRAYLSLLAYMAQIGSNDVKNVLPRYFFEQESRMARDRNTLESFLQSDRVQYAIPDHAKQVYVPTTST